MREIPLTQGKVALIDDEDYEEVSRHRWHAVLNKRKRSWYAQRTVLLGDGKGTTIKMHVAIMGRDPSGRGVDHRSLDGLDNRRPNLRWATAAQQTTNRGVRSDSLTGLKGVQRRYKSDGSTATYRARIQIEGVPYRLGSFDTAAEAARAYDVAAREAFGEYARLNFETE